MAASVVKLVLRRGLLSGLGNAEAHMPKGTTHIEKLDLSIGGKSLAVKDDGDSARRLNQALRDPDDFAQFAADPAKFAKGHGLEISKDMAEQLKVALNGVESLQEAVGKVGMGRNPGDVMTTVWAVVAGAYSVASTKVAVAFKGVDLADTVAELSALQAVRVAAQRFGR